MVRSQLNALPLQSTLQPVNVEPLLGVALSVTVLPKASVSAQSLPQFMPAGLLVTLPLPLMLTVSSSGRASAGALLVLLSLQPLSHSGRISSVARRTRPLHAMFNSVIVRSIISSPYCRTRPR